MRLPVLGVGRTQVARPSATEYRNSFPTVNANPRAGGACPVGPGVDTDAAARVLPDHADDPSSAPPAPAVAPGPAARRRGSGAAGAPVAAAGGGPAVGVRQPVPRCVDLLRLLPGPAGAPAGVPRLLRVQPADGDAARLGDLSTAAAGYRERRAAPRRVLRRRV